MGFSPKVKPPKALGGITLETVNVSLDQPKLKQNRFSPEPITALWKLRHFWKAAKCLGGSRYGSARTLRRYARRRAPEGSDSVRSLLFERLEIIPKPNRGGIAMGVSDVVACPHCRGQIRNAPNLAGQQVACPHCKRLFSMPALAVVPQGPPPVSSPEATTDSDPLDFLQPAAPSSGPDRLLAASVKRMSSEGVQMAQKFLGRGTKALKQTFGDAVRHTRTQALVSFGHLLKSPFRQVFLTTLFVLTSSLALETLVAASPIERWLPLADNMEQFQKHWRQGSQQGNFHFDPESKTVTIDCPADLGGFACKAKWKEFYCEMVINQLCAGGFDLQLKGTSFQLGPAIGKLPAVASLRLKYDPASMSAIVLVNGTEAGKATIVDKTWTNSFDCMFRTRWAGGWAKVQLRNVHIRVDGRDAASSALRSDWVPPDAIETSKDTSTPNKGMTSQPESPQLAASGPPSPDSDKSLEKEAIEHRRRFLAGQLAAPATPSQEVAPLPIPNDHAQAEAMKLIKEVYGEEWAAAKTLAEKQALAKKLLRKGTETEKDAVTRFVLFKLARDIATRASDGETAFEAVDEMGESFQIDAWEMKLDILAAGTKLAQLPEHHHAIAEQVLPLIDQALAEDKYDVANRLGQLGLSAAEKAKDTALLKQAQASVKSVSEAAKAFQEVEAATKTLEDKPVDPDANLAVGKYLCFIKGDWKQGRSMLLLGSDATLKALVLKEMEGGSEAADQAKLGDGWWELAEKEEGVAQGNLQHRAKSWYEKVLPGLTGLMKQKIEKRLAADEPQETGKQSSAVTAKSWMVIFCSSDPRRWNTDTNQGRRDFGIPIANVPSTIKYLKMAVSPKQFVIISITKKDLDSVSDSDTIGWNGKNPLVYNAHHLGIYNKSWRAKKDGTICTLNGGFYVDFSGWGLGYRSKFCDRQSYVWAGQEIPVTVFEISVKSSPLTKAEQTLLLQGGASQPAQPRNTPNKQTHHGRHF